MGNSLTLEPVRILLVLGVYRDSGTTHYICRTSIGQTFSKLSLKHFNVVITLYVCCDNINCDNSIGNELTSEAVRILLVQESTAIVAQHTIFVGFQ